jgi:hypothetical protein
MPNSYSTVPAIIPGNLTVQGTLLSSGAISSQGGTVGADTATANSARHTRIIAGTGVNDALTFNLQSDLVTRDAVTIAAFALYDELATQTLRLRLVNAVGNAMDTALEATLLSVSAPVANGGNVEATLYSKLIRGGIIGNNGIVLLRFAINPSVQGGVATTVRVKLGAVTLWSYTYAALTTSFGELFFCNENAAATNHTVARSLVAAAPSAVTVANAGVDTSVDQALAVTVQGGAGTDAWAGVMCHAALLNTFGPV